MSHCTYFVSGLFFCLLMDIRLSSWCPDPSELEIHLPRTQRHPIPFLPENVSPFCPRSHCLIYFIAPSVLCSLPPRSFNRLTIFLLIRRVVLTRDPRISFLVYFISFRLATCHRCGLIYTIRPMVSLGLFAAVSQPSS